MSRQHNIIMDDVDAARESRPLHQLTAQSEVVYLLNACNGWWKDRRELMDAHPSGRTYVTIACLGLITSEVAEAMEAVRKHDPQTWGDWKTKDTLVRELAGTIVRVLDLSAALNLDIGAAFDAELEANSKRGHKHGGKAA